LNKRFGTTCFLLCCWSCFTDLFLRVHLNRPDVNSAKWNFCPGVKFTGWSFASAFTEALGELIVSATDKTRMCVCGCRTGILCGYWCES